MNVTTNAKSVGSVNHAGIRGQKKWLVAVLVLLVGGAGAAAAFKWMNREKPVPSAAQDNAEKLKSAMQRAETEARAKSPPAEVPADAAVEPTRAARGVK